MGTTFTNVFGGRYYGDEKQNSSSYNEGIRLAVKFEYRQIVDGKAVPLSGLEREVEARVPNHQVMIARTMTNFGLGEWTVIITPMKSSKGGGMAGHPVNQIFLAAKASEYEMHETLYHEIFHVKLPYVSEEEIESMGKTMMELMNKYE